MYARRHTPRQWKELKWSGKAFNTSIIKLFLCYTEPLQALNSPLVEKQLAIYVEFWQNQKGGMHSLLTKKNKTPSIHGFIRYNTVIKVNIGVMFYDQSKTMRPNE